MLFYACKNVKLKTFYFYQTSVQWHFLILNKELYNMKTRLCPIRTLYIIVANKKIFSKETIFASDIETLNPKQTQFDTGMHTMSDYM